MIALIKLAFLSLTLVVFASCNTLEIRRTKFITEPASLQTTQVKAFAQAKSKPNFDHTRWTSITVAPVSTAHLMLNADQQNAHKEQAVREDAQELAVFAHQALEQAVQKDKQASFRLASEPQDDGVTLEMAITELDPTERAACATGYAVSAFGGMVAQPIFSFAGGLMRKQVRGVIAVEACLRDNRTGEVLLVFADKEPGRVSLVSVKDLQRYGHAKYQLRTWAKQLVQWMKHPDRPVRDPLPVTLNPL